MIPDERLEPWRACQELVPAGYRVSEDPPQRERCEPTSQVRAAAASVVASIAEGSTKRGRKAFRRHLDTASVHRQDSPTRCN